MRAVLFGMLHLLAAAAMPSFAANLTDQTLKSPPNLVAISNLVVAFGQPSARWLRTPKAQGFEAVIYLAPPTVDDAVRDEHTIVAGQGLAFVYIRSISDDPPSRTMNCSRPWYAASRSARCSCTARSTCARRR